MRLWGSLWMHWKDGLVIKSNLSLLTQSSRWNIDLHMDSWNISPHWEISTCSFLILYNSDLLSVSSKIYNVTAVQRRLSLGLSVGLTGPHVRRLRTACVKEFLTHFRHHVENKEGSQFKLWRGLSPAVKFHLSRYIYNLVGTIEVLLWWVERELWRKDGILIEGTSSRCHSRVLRIEGRAIYLYLGRALAHLNWQLF